MHRARQRKSFVMVLRVTLLAFILVLVGCGSNDQGTQSSTNTSTSTPDDRSGSQTPSPSSTQGEQSKSEANDKAETAMGQPAEKSISIGTHPTSSSYYAVGSALAKVVSENAPFTMSAKPFGGPNAWMPLLDRGEIQLGISNAADAAWAFEGSFGYPQPAKNARLLMVGHYTKSPGIIVRRDSGMTKITDLRGKRVASGYGGNQASGHFVESYLTSVGMTWDDVVQVPVSDIPAGIKLLKEKRVDATYGAALSTPSVVEAHNAIGVLALNLADLPPDQIDSFPKELLPKMDALLPGSAPIVGEKGEGYLDEDRTLIQTSMVLTATASLSDEAAYHVVKALWENYKELHPIYDLMEHWYPERMFTLEPDLPYHPGAIQFYKEQGLWTDEVEQRQNDLMAKAK